jgi:two-component system, sensor histidine kinase
LSIVRRLAALMGGEAGVVSREGAGSTFWFTATFATVDGAVAESTGSAATDRQSSSSAELRTCRVLVADDNVVNQKVARMMLLRLGADVEVADNGVEAVEAWKKGEFDLILMDCQMPDLDGFSATRAIREQERPGKRTPIVALTANAMKGEEAKCLIAGMDGYLTKPITLDALRTCLARWRGEVGEPMTIVVNESAGARSVTG